MNKNEMIAIAQAMNDFFEYCRGIADTLQNEEIHQRIEQAEKKLEGLFK